MMIPPLVTKTGEIRYVEADEVVVAPIAEESRPHQEDETGWDTHATPHPRRPRRVQGFDDGTPWDDGTVGDPGAIAAAQAARGDRDPVRIPDPVYLDPRPTPEPHVITIMRWLWVVDHHAGGLMMDRWSGLADGTVWLDAPDGWSLLTGDPRNSHKAIAEMSWLAILRSAFVWERAHPDQPWLPEYTMWWSSREADKRDALRWGRFMQILAEQKAWGLLRACLEIRQAGWTITAQGTLVPHPDTPEAVHRDWLETSRLWRYDVLPTALAGVRDGLPDGGAQGTPEGCDPTMWRAVPGTVISSIELLPPKHREWATQRRYPDAPRGWHIDRAPALVPSQAQPTPLGVFVTADAIQWERYVAAPTGDAPEDVAWEAHPVSPGPHQPHTFADIVATLRRSPILGLDIETSGQPVGTRGRRRDTRGTALDPIMGQIEMLQISDRPDRAFLFRWTYLSETQRKALVEVLADPGPLWVIYNASFELRYILAKTDRATAAGQAVWGGTPEQPENVLPRQVADLMLAYQVETPGVRPANFEAAFRTWLNWQVDKGHQKDDWSQPTLSPAQKLYGARDAAFLLYGYDHALAALRAQYLEGAWWLENQAVRGMSDLIYTGLYLDLDEMGARKTAQKQRQTELLAELTAMAPIKPSGSSQLAFEGITSPEPWNFNSPEQMVQCLNLLGIPVSNTDADSLKPFEAEPFVKALLEYRSITKDLGSFLDAWGDYVHPVSGRIHGEYKQAAARTGRMSCEAPNLQQIPHDKAVRALFKPQEGNVFVICDYGQIELRIMADMSGDASMLDAIRHGIDLHARTAALVNAMEESVFLADVAGHNGPDAKAQAKSMRQAAKAVNFGLIYGMGPNGLKDYALTAYNVVMTPEEARQFRDRFFAGYKGVRQWHREQDRIVADKPTWDSDECRGLMETRTRSGRLRRFRDARDARLTTITNTPVQGTGSDIMKLAIATMVDPLRARGAHMVATVHDEIIVECPERDAEAVKDLVEQTMLEAAATFLQGTPVEADAAIGRSWADKA